MLDLDEIYVENFETVYKYMICLTQNEDVAEELTQETFFKAVQKINTFKGECKISVWLCQIAKNLWYNYIKKQKRYDINGENALLLQIADHETENEAISQLERIELYRKLQNVDPLTRKVIYLRITGDLSFKEIGEIINKC